MLRSGRSKRQLPLTLTENYMNHRLTKDEFDALEQVSKTPKTARPSASVARNAKRLNGLKYLAYGKDGKLVLTENGQQVLFVQNCINALRMVATDPLAKMAADVANFLGKKGYISPTADGFEMTARGQECLADIDATSSRV